VGSQAEEVFLIGGQEIKREGLMFKKYFAVLLFVFLLSGNALAVEFSADTISTYKGEHETQGKMYFKPDKYRMDMKAHGDMIMITRVDKKVIWNIMPAQKMYMEMPFDLRNKPKVEEKFEGEIDRKLVGNETIDGHPAKKYLITYKSGNEKHQVYQWFATDINFPVKTSAIDGSWSQEFKNIKIGSQPDSLFEVPAGYKKIQMPGGMNFKD
jgi:outer membrane lipoprotein-sorting protein